MEDAAQWLARLDEAEGVSLSGLQECQDEDAEILRSLCGAGHVMACAILSGNVPAGLLCVCNPSLHTDTLLPHGTDDQRPLRQQVRHRQL